MRALFTDTAGKLNSALLFRAGWHVVAVALCVWYAAKNGPDLGLLSFAGAMATGEGMQYAWRRGQDRKAGVGIIPPPAPGALIAEGEHP